MDTVIKTPRQDKKNSPVKGWSLSPVFPPTPLETSVCHMLGVHGMGQTCLINSCLFSLETFVINPKKRGRIMGFGGSKIRELAQKTGVQMSPVDDSVFELFAPDSAAMEEGKTLLNSWLEEKVLNKRHGYPINLTNNSHYRKGKPVIQKFSVFINIFKII